MLIHLLLELGVALVVCRDLSTLGWLWVWKAWYIASTSLDRSLFTGFFLKWWLLLLLWLLDQTFDAHRFAWVIALSLWSARSILIKFHLIWSARSSQNLILISDFLVQPCKPLRQIRLLYSRFGVLLNNMPPEWLSAHEARYLVLLPALCAVEF